MSREAMKLALEALQYIEHNYMSLPASAEKAIIALKQALEQPEPEPVAWAISYDGETPYTLWDGGDCALLDIEVKRHGGKTRKMPLYTAPPKREPEPVIDKSAAIRIATSLGWTPKREWQGLTEREVDECYELVMYDMDIEPSRFRVYQAIEAKLKEKNT